MPILSEEMRLFPESLLEDTAALTEPDADERSLRRWWVLYTKARQEKAVARDLAGYEIPFYLPLTEKHAVYRRRRVTSHVPVFAGYVFLYGSEQERVRSLTTNRLSRILEVGDQDRLLADLRHLERLIASRAPLTVESRLVPGDRVRVRRGLLAGVEGTVLTRRGCTRLLVSVNFLQRGASVEIDDFLLEPIR